MNALLFAFRRTLRARGFLMLLILCAAAVFLSSLQGSAGQTPPAGVCDLSGSELSRRVTDWLTDNGFVLCSSPEEAEALVSRGELNCALILPTDLETLVRECRLEGQIPFLTSPTSYAPELYRNAAAAALFRERAPYLTAEALSHTEISGADALARYWEMFQQGAPFSFQIATAEGAPLPLNGSERALTMGGLAILLMAALLTGFADLTEGSFPEMAARLGSGTAIRSVLLPQLAARAFLAAAAGVIGLAAGSLAGSAHCSALIVPTLIYVLVLTDAALLLAALLPRRHHSFVLLSLLLPAALALCPIFWDLSLFSPLSGALRAVVPACWLWSVADHPLPWLVCGVIALPLSVGAPVLRLQRRMSRPSGKELL